MASGVATKSRYIHGEFITQKCLRYFNYYLFQPDHSLRSDGLANHSSRLIVSDAEGVGDAANIFAYLLSRSNYSHSEYTLISGKEIRSPDGVTGIDFNVIRSDGAEINHEAVQDWLKSLSQRRKTQRLIFVSESQAEYLKHNAIISKVPGQRHINILHIASAEIELAPNQSIDFRLLHNSETAFGEFFVRFSSDIGLSRSVRKEWIEALELKSDLRTDILRAAEPVLQIGFGYDKSDDIKFSCHWLFKIDD